MNQATALIAKPLLALDQGHGTHRDLLDLLDLLDLANLLRRRVR